MSSGPDRNRLPRSQLGRRQQESRRHQGSKNGHLRASWRCQPIVKNGVVIGIYVGEGGRWHFGRFYMAEMRVEESCRVSLGAVMVVSMEVARLQGCKREGNSHQPR